MNSSEAQPFAEQWWSAFQADGGVIALLGNGVVVIGAAIALMVIAQLIKRL